MKLLRAVLDWDEQAVDVIAEKNGKRWPIRVKCQAANRNTIPQKTWPQSVEGEIDNRESGATPDLPPPQ